MPQYRGTVNNNNKKKYYMKKILTIFMFLFAVSINASTNTTTTDVNEVEINVPAKIIETVNSDCDEFKISVNSTDEIIKKLLRIEKVSENKWKIGIDRGIDWKNDAEVKYLTEYANITINILSPCKVKSISKNFNIVKN